MSSIARNIPRLTIMLGVVFLVACNPFSGKPPSTGVLNLKQAFDDDGGGGFARATGAREFNFPRDHSSHPDFKHEWWYFTGNLQTKNEQHLGYELTLFRVGLVPRILPSDVSDSLSLANPGAIRENKESKWRSDSIYMAHFAVTDVGRKRYYQQERFSRDSLGLAGAMLSYREKIEKDVTTLKLWVSDWKVESLGDTVFPIKIIAQQGGLAVDLLLNPTKAVVLEGDRGFVRKGDQPGNASYYYTIPRLSTRGTITINGEPHKVQGNSWFDREWSTSALGKDVKGWDWFSIQLADKRDIMLYQLRREDDSVDPNSRGTLIEENGDFRTLERESYSIEVLDYWESPHTGVKYPAAWRVSIPSESLELEIIPLLEDQEFNQTMRYWEGAVKITGHKIDAPEEIIKGYGYVELAGYES